MQNKSTKRNKKNGQLPVYVYCNYFSGWFSAYMFLQISTADTIETKMISESKTIDTVLRSLRISNTTPRIIYKMFAIKPIIKDVFEFIIIIPLFKILIF